MAEKFYTDGMSVKEILDLDYKTLNKLNERDMSRALRTVSLAANKRIDRLVQNAVLRKNEFIEKKSGKKKIALDALNKLYDESGQSVKAMRFSVGNKDRNKMYAELMRAKDFMNLKTSTVKGAEEVRKAREVRLYGKTREEYSAESTKKFINRTLNATGKKPTKKQIKEYQARVEKRYEKLNSKAWRVIREALEISKISLNYGSDEVVERVSTRVRKRDKIQDIIDDLIEGATTSYEKKQEEEKEEEKSFFEQAGFDFGSSMDNYMSF